MATRKQPSPGTQYRRPTYQTQNETYSGQYQYVRIPNQGFEIPLWLVAAIIAGLISLCLLPFLLSLGYYGYYQFSEKIVPGVKVGDLELGGVDIRSAAAEMGAYYELERYIAVTNGFQTWNIPPAQLGLSINTSATIHEAYSIGHYQGLNENVNQMLTSLIDGWQVLPVVSFDREAAQAGIEEIAKQAGKPAQDASLSLVSGEWVSTPAELGYAVNIEDTLEALQTQKAGVMATGQFQLKIIPLAPEVNDVTIVQEEAQTFLETPVEIKGYDPISNEYFNWPVSKDTLGTWIKSEAGDQGPTVGIDTEKVAAYLTDLSETLDGNRWLDAEKYSLDLAQAIAQGNNYWIIVNHKATTYTVQKGDTLLKVAWKNGFPMWYLLNANPDLNPDALVTGENIVIPSKDEMLPLPVIPGKRIVMSINKQKMWVYANDKQVKKFVISTGIDKSPTQPGIFQVQSHKKNAYASEWDLYMPHFLGIYEAWPGFMNGIHGLPTLSNGTQLWANILGKPASYGCIILDLDDAKWLYNWAEDGVVVEIYN